jgi:hypothetical protein
LTSTIDNNAACEISIQANEIKARFRNTFDRSLTGVEAFTVNETITIIISGGNRGIMPRFEYSKKSESVIRQSTKRLKLIFLNLLRPASTVRSSK